MALTTDQPTVELGDIDLLDRDVFAERVPHEWFATCASTRRCTSTPSPTAPASG